MKKVNIVIGANYGDEGKGLVSSFVTPQDGVIVLGNGGPQRGHTAWHKGHRHVFHHFGSAAMKGAISYFPKTFMVNPATIGEELAELERLSDRKPAFFASPECFVTTPFDMLVNIDREKKRGSNRSTGYGIWETRLRYEAGKFMALGDYWSSNEEIWRGELSKIADHYEGQGLGLGNRQGIIDAFIGDLYGMFNHPRFFGCYGFKDVAESFDVVTFEMGQGLALDYDYDVDNGTPSYTGSTNPAELLAEIGYKGRIDRYYVSRSYLTRHGDGRLPGENPSLSFPDFTNKPNDYQGKIRFAEFSDESLQELSGRLANDRMKLKANDIFVITHMNELPASEKLAEAAKNGGIKAIMASWDEESFKPYKN